MTSVWHLVVISLAYISSLFLIAWYGDKRAQTGRPIHNSGTVYSLSLAVYCTSWTFYGAVGQAATSGWIFLTIYIGPIAFLLFFSQFLKKIIHIAQEKRLTSIADFIGNRYGRDHTLAIIITLVAILGGLPYIALQLKAIATTFELATSPINPVNQSLPFWEDTAFHISWIMASFVIMFGTRDIDASEQHPGMILAVAFESIVKLVAILILGIWVVFFLYDQPLGFLEQAKQNLPNHALFNSDIISAAFIVQSVLAGFAILCLPRQFQVAIIENENARHIHTARWLFPLYLALMLVSIVPIALTGQMYLQGAGVAPDTYVLSLPVALEQETLSIIAFIGGASAATGMIIVSAIAISTMVSNELVLPIFFRNTHNQAERYQSLKIRRLVLTVRRLVILGLMLGSYLFYRAIGEFESLASIGLLAFAAVVQFAPALVGGMLWQGANRQGAIAGVLGGAFVWFSMLLWPLLNQTLEPQATIDFAWLTLDQFSHGVIISLWINISLFIFFSFVTNTSVRERMLASDFMNNKALKAANSIQNPPIHCRVDDVRVVLERVLGEHKTAEFFHQYQDEYGLQLDSATASVQLLKQSEKLLASVVGSSSAQVIFSTLLGGEQVHIGDLAFLASEASQAYTLSREQLQAALENLQQGVSVIDSDLNLVAWNRRYLELLNYPEDLIYVGKPVAELIEFNARRGFCGVGDLAQQVNRRLEFLQARSAHQFERQLPSGTVILTQGHPMPDGGFVTSFTDITMHKRAEQALKEANISLEQRVEESSQELSDLTAQLIEANQSKTRFLAAAGHDLMQPLNAAKLFASTLAQHSMASEPKQLLDHLEGSLESVEAVLSVLVEISKLDAGAVEPKVGPLHLGTLLKPLRDEFTALAADKNIQLRTRCGDYWVVGDAHWLRRIIQNLLANAVRYTDNGGVLLACRKRGQELAIEIWDTGPGIAQSKLKEIFQEFKRIPGPNTDSKGLGLGLAIVERMASKLGYRIEVESWVSYGSRFRLLVPLAEPQNLETNTQHAAAQAANNVGSFDGLKVFVIDNDNEVLTAMTALLSSWQCEVYNCKRLEQALNIPFEPAVLLADYQLDNDETGLEVMQALQRKFNKNIAGVLISADPRESTEEKAKELGFYFLRKPLKPAALRALLRRIIR